MKTGLSRSEFHFLLLPFIKGAAACHYTVISVKYIIKLQRTLSALPLLLHKVDSAVKNAIKFDVITATNCPIYFFTAAGFSAVDDPDLFTSPFLHPHHDSPHLPVVPLIPAPYQVETSPGACFRESQMKLQTTTTVNN